MKILAIVLRVLRSFFIQRSFSVVGSLVLLLIIQSTIINPENSGLIAQNVGINTVSPDSSAALDITSTQSGLLVPRMTTNNRDNINNPAISLLIFNTDNNCFQTYINGQWNNIWCFDTVSTFTCGTSTVDDIDGNTYNTVQIGTQCWLKENMRTTKYPDNSAITKGPSAHGDPGWISDLAYYSCPPNTANDGEDCAAAASLGMLYQWSAAMNGAAGCNGTGSSQPKCSIPVQGICPDGWHIPSHYEWTQLERQICNDNLESNCATEFLYDETTTGWYGNSEGSSLAGNVTAQNWTAGTLTGDSHFDDSGLDIVPSGFRFSNGDYYYRGNSSLLRSSTESGTNAWRRDMEYTFTNVNRNVNDKAYGFSVRCLKD